jgi:hypothetical protein
MGRMLLHIVVLAWLATILGRPRQIEAPPKRRGTHASKEKGKEEEVTTEHLQVSSFPQARFRKRALFSSNTTSASTAKGQRTFILRPGRRSISFASSATC